MTKDKIPEYLLDQFKAKWLTPEVSKVVDQSMEQESGASTLILTLSQIPSLHDLNLSLILKKLDDH